MSELRPCPFCGGEASLTHDYSSESGDWWIVDCLNKDCPMMHSRGSWDSVNVTTGWRKTEAKAIEAWNTRTYPEGEVMLMGNRVFIAGHGHYTKERTCQNLEKRHVDMFKCSACGFWDCQDFVNYSEYPQVWDYCPGCGARVKEATDAD